MDTTPSYTTPPVVETVLGFQFQPIPKLTTAQMSLFWQSLGSDWPRNDDAAPIPMHQEFFGLPEEQLSRIAEVLQEGPVTIRQQMRDKSGTRMLQVQNGRFHYNWIGLNSAENPESYPRFTTIYPEFINYLRRFKEFMDTNRLGELRPLYWEVTYLNHIHQGQLWSTLNDLSNIFSIFNEPQTCASHVRLESFTGAWRFEIPERLGRLHVKIEHGYKKTDPSQEILIADFTARGPLPKDATIEQLCDGVQLGHDVIVRTFDNILATKAQELWGKEHGN